MSFPGIRRGVASTVRVLPGPLLVLLSLLTVVWFAPEVPYPAQDSAWVLALNQAVADHLAFGRDVLFTLGPWGTVYAGQYHPATDGMMLAGGAIVALALAGGLWALARGGRRWVVLLAPVLVATVGQHDPLFLCLPVLMLAMSIAVAQDGAAERFRVAALLLLTSCCALLSLIKGTFGTQAVPMVALALLALAIHRRYRLAAVLLTLYAASLVGFWLWAGQRLPDLPGYLSSMPVVISGYTEGLALDGPVSDIAAYGGGAALLLILLWRGGARRPGIGTVLLMLGVLFTLFVAFKSGFVRHDEHALIAAGTLALLPVVLVHALRARPLAAALVVSLCVLSFISHNFPGHEWHPSFQWPSVVGARDRLVRAATNAWVRVADPGRWPRYYDANMAAGRIMMPLPPVTGPSDSYSSGQMALLANGLDWSPRPALQSVTVFSGALEQADLDHLQGADGHPPVQNVFYRVENEDNRLRSTQDGLSWPTLLTAFQVTWFDRGLDTALLQRRPDEAAARPLGVALLDGRYRLGEEVAIPASPTGLTWATLDVEPTAAGRLADLLFRPPFLTVAIRYADGPVEHYRLVSGLARAGFMLTARVLTTEDMLRLLLPESRAAGVRPVSIRLTGQSGTRWLWQPRFTLHLHAMDIPLQDHVRDLLRPAPLLPVPAPQPAEAAADNCAIEVIDGRPASPEPRTVQGIAEVGGWAIVSLKDGDVADQVVLRLTDAAGHAWDAAAMRRPRLDVAGYFVNPALTQSGFAARFDVSALAGDYTMAVIARRGTSSWQCKPTQRLHVIAPPPGG